MFYNPCQHVWPLLNRARRVSKRSLGDVWRQYGQCLEDVQKGLEVVWTTIFDWEILFKFLGPKFLSSSVPVGSQVPVELRLALNLNNTTHPHPPTHPGKFMWWVVMVVCKPSFMFRLGPRLNKTVFSFHMPYNSSATFFYIGIHDSIED